MLHIFLDSTKYKREYTFLFFYKIINVKPNETIVTSLSLMYRTFRHVKKSLHFVREY